MDLLKPDELNAWLLNKFGSASQLAKQLGLSRQTAHNLLTGRTIPNGETCQKLGLELVYFVSGKEGRKEMQSLDDFLSNRSDDRANVQAGAELLRTGGSATLEELKKATQAAAERVGRVDQFPLEWHSQPFTFLKLGYVAAAFTPGLFDGGYLKACRIRFDRIPGAMYVDDNPLDTEIWDITLSVLGEKLVWDVNGGELLGLPSEKLAEQIVIRLIEYRDRYRDAFASIFGAHLRSHL